MSNSKAKRKREHDIRNGGRDVRNSRGMNMNFSTHERKTKTKKEKVVQNIKKHKKRPLQQIHVDEGLFFYASFSF
ncbi:hypothetical protein QA612_05340 [Evansella sp. AB-P1]|uniref:hypothetical protein n=1 Tax=Evansella sp. AB-P1 TaxID=3037653 RepID=UPI00241C5AF9|nr:hypothetical protein [Evansella sp. AB-P1]MDG5786907.1 hypothetical protein [Evansella sp. AB-P1]